MEEKDNLIDNLQKASKDLQNDEKRLKKEIIELK
jgi:cell division septum initiation protein DivIVA